MRNRVEIKSDAKQLIRVSRVSPLVMSARLVIITFVLERLPMLAGFPFFTAKYVQTCLDAMVTGSYAAVDEMILSMLQQASPFFFFLPILVSLATLVLNSGYYIYCMGIRRGMVMPYSTLMDGLGVAGKLIWCWVQMTVRLFLWTSLFIIPGIIAAYRYRFAYYNILTDGSLSAGDAIRLSCQQTYGVKMELFILDLSFIGWNLLVPFTFGVLNIWLIPYMTLCDIAYFEDAQNRLGRSFFSGNGWEL